MTNNTPTVSRRETLAGIGLVAIATGASASANNSAAWDAAMAHFKLCDHAVNSFSFHLNMVEQTYMDAVSALPHTTVTYPSGLTASTSDESNCRRVKASCEQVRYLELAAVDWHKADMQLVAAYEARQQRISELRTSTGYRTAEERHDLLVDRLVDARDVLMAMPAPTPKALLWKLEYFMEDTPYQDDFVAPTIADMRRLLGA